MGPITDERAKGCLNQSSAMIVNQTGFEGQHTKADESFYDIVQTYLEPGMLEINKARLPTRIDKRFPTIAAV